jgi:hypothetical protein
VFAYAGKTGPPSRLILSQTSAGKVFRSGYVIAGSSFCAVSVAVGVELGIKRIGSLPDPSSAPRMPGHGPGRSSRSEEQARNLNASLEQRFAECGLTLHPEKTKIVYCKDDDRRGTYRDQSSIFSAIRSGRGCRADGKGSVSRSAQRRATKLSKRFGRQFAAGRYMSAATSRLMIWRGCSTRTSVAGSTIMAGTTSQLFTRPFGTSTASWRDGLIGSSSP